MRQAQAFGWLVGFLILLFISPWFVVIVLGLLAPLMIAGVIAIIPVAFVYAMFHRK